MCASPLWGALADRSGRRRAALWSGWTAAGASLLSAVAPTFPLLLLARFLVGAAVAGLPVAVYPLCTEVVGPRARGRAGILSQSVYHLGEWLLPLLAWSLGDWRRLCLAVAFSGAVTTAVLARWAPESPRWLLVSGREGEARRVLDGLSRGNGRGGLPAGLRLGLYSSSSLGCKRRHQQQQQHGAGGGAASAEASAAAAAAAAAATAAAAAASSGRDEGEGGGGIRALLRHPRSRALLIASSAATGVAAAAFYIFSMVDSALPGPLAWNFFLTSAAELPFALLLAHLIDAWGRRPAVSALLAGGGLAAAACGALGSPPSSSSSSSSSSWP
jgi:MFS family permease